MSPFAIQITNGCLISDIEQEDQNSFQALQQLGAIEEVDGLWKLHSLYRAGRLYLGKDGRGYVEAEFKEQRLDSATDKQLIDAMVNTPKLIERPIVSNGSTAIIGRPPENVLAIC